MTEVQERYLSRREQSERYGCDERTIIRWGENPELGYPPEYDFNGRKRRRLSALERWERKRAATASSRKRAG